MNAPEKNHDTKGSPAKKDYSATVRLPRTDFPMKANLPVRELEIQRFWTENAIYQRVQEQARSLGLPKFILHDGPPYANGHIHIGHALNKVLKDIVVKYKALRGFHTPYEHGWDTHGLPIEAQVIKDLGLNRHETSPVEFRARCRDYALRYAAIQAREIKRLGVWGNWERSYYTLRPEYEAAQIGVFGAMAKKGFIYKGKKPVYWCTHCETALAEAEIEYDEHTSPSIWVKFAVADDKGIGLLPGGRPEKPTYILIWTTTPWTLPANFAIALHPDYDYALVDVGGERWIVAKELVDTVRRDTGRDKADILRAWKGRELEGVVCRHPFLERESVVVLGDHVTLDQGTGCVHTAPGHGLEDFLVGQKYGLPIFAPVTDDGHFTEEAGPFAGLELFAANKEIIAAMKRDGSLAAHGDITHQYPHCWRCKNPVIFRATEQWFASVRGFRDQALKAAGEVRWIPRWGEERIKSMIAERGDWCISRQRVWGVPIPIFYCEGCGEHLINDATIAAVQELFAREGSDAWFTHEAHEILPEYVRCPHCGGARFRKEKDIMDVWFDSGSSHAAVLATRSELDWPADLYLEGSDQHRGWFQSSLLTAVATTGRAPYRAVLTHGYTVDAEGYKMSKSVGNVIAPSEVIEKYGADILRLWVASADYTDDVRISDGILKQISEVYRRIRNTFRFLLGNLGDFDPREDRVKPEELTELDRWALAKLADVGRQVREAYDNYEFHRVYHLVHNFCAVDLSAFYLDVLKDRLYTEAPKGLKRRAAQTALFEILQALVRFVAPILAHTAEEVWQHIPGPKTKSVQLCFWPDGLESFENKDLLERWDGFLRLRSEVAKALERARADKFIGNSLEASVTVFAPSETTRLLAPFANDLPELFIVSAARIAGPGEPVPPEVFKSEAVPGLAVLVSRAEGAKCERCWQYSPTVGEDDEHPGLCRRCAAVVRSLS